MRYSVLASDYDGTLAHDGIVDASTVAALKKARAAGLRLILVTGREMADLSRTFDDLHLFEQIVAENGALIFDPLHRTERVLAAPPPPKFIEILSAQNIPLSIGRSIVATVEPHQTIVLEAIHELGLEWHIIFNKGSVMALPSGVNKATGLSALLKQLSIPPAQVVGVGDAENDMAFLQLCGFSVAVANALPSVKESADFTTQGTRGAGVAELIERLLNDSLDAVARNGSLNSKKQNSPSV